MRILYFLYITITIFTSSLLFTSAQTVSPEQQEALKNELKQLEAQIQSHKKVIEEKQKEGKSLQRDITILDSKIKKTETEIKSTDKSIQGISYNIKEKESNILILDKKISREKLFMEEALKKMRTDRVSNFTVALLSEDTFSESFDKINNLDDLKSNLHSSIQNIKVTKDVLNNVKTELEVKKEEAEDLKNKKIVLKNEILENKQEKDSVLKITKGQEKLYQATLADTEKKANEIRSKLFSFQDGTSVKFGDLYDFATRASKSTGVRVEFILAILEQESAFGTNVGQCYVTNDIGSLKHITTQKDRGSMKPDSLSPFFEIVTALDRDKFKTRVSCALSYGYGGAMGISQFMPATWLGFQSKIKNATGATYADPWNSAHAIMGSGFLLQENGASSQAFSAERNAACKYYSGRSCSNSTVATNYGNQVMSRISGIQAKIEVLKNN